MSEIERCDSLIIHIENQLNKARNKLKLAQEEHDIFVNYSSEYHVLSPRTISKVMDLEGKLKEIRSIRERLRKIE